MTAAPPPSAPERDVEPGSVGADPRLWLSALADGERAALPHATALWRDDPDARERWHLYHLVGDVLRSEDLASTPARDAAFLASLRDRLVREPVPLAPEAPAVPSATAATAAPAAPVVVGQATATVALAPAARLGWRAPAAVAAGVAVVAAALVYMRPSGYGAAESGAPLAAGSASVAGSGVRAVSNPLPSAAGALVAEGSMLRDPQLSAYLRAHQAARGNSPAALPGGGLRSVEILVTPPAALVAPAVPGASRAAASAARAASHPAAAPALTLR